jgi:hypothetical protein
MAPCAARGFTVGMARKKDVPKGYRKPGEPGQTDKPERASDVPRPNTAARGGRAKRRPDTGTPEAP